MNKTTFIIKHSIKGIDDAVRKALLDISQEINEKQGHIDVSFADIADYILEPQEAKTIISQISPSLLSEILDICHEQVRKELS